MKYKFNFFIISTIDTSFSTSTLQDFYALWTGTGFLFIYFFTTLENLQKSIKKFVYLAVFYRKSRCTWALHLQCSGRGTLELQFLYNFFLHCGLVDVRKLLFIQEAIFECKYEIKKKIDKNKSSCVDDSRVVRWLKKKQPRFYNSRGREIFIHGFWTSKQVSLYRFILFVCTKMHLK